MQLDLPLWLVKIAQKIWVMIRSMQGFLTADGLLPRLKSCEDLPEQISMLSLGMFEGIKPLTMTSEQFSMLSLRTFDGVEPLTGIPYMILEPFPLLLEHFPILSLR